MTAVLPNFLRALLRDAAYLAQGGGDGTGADIALEESL